MARIQDDILETFLKRLGESERVDETLAKAIRALLQATGKPKPDALAAAYRAAAAGDTR